MTLTEHLPLHPSPASAWVVPAFYGGPMDGDYLPPVNTGELRGRLSLNGGHYELVGFRVSGSSLPDELRQYCMDYAVYEWT